MLVMKCRWFCCTIYFAFQNFISLYPPKPAIDVPPDVKHIVRHSNIKLLKIYENVLNKHKRIVHTPYNNIKY